ncbi:polymorphic toxin type 8 domain-containing protein [Riemerella anatipestifer]|uniref:polymorphic toxin type 8 domain-containing protein n=4 Tax=Riemerella anatipestifer TaxID=34085 RepID=UPI00285713DF|nr:polymorphic toxin type 8 domain-containing protein [Riemerella anatipestifer]MDR7740760.1 polymorphic toxin type 8 domain-containing protein [Riemerella anatipestifer]
MSVVDNVTGGNLSQKYDDGSTEYRKGVISGNVASGVTGAFLMVTGGIDIGAGGTGLAASGAVSTTGAGTVVGVPGAVASGGLIITGTAKVTLGSIMMYNSSKNIKNDNSSESNKGRSGKQVRLRELSDDPKLGKADKGWLKSDINKVNQGKRKTIRNPPGKDLAHERGREAAKGYSYEYSHLQNRKDHRNQHKYDNGGRKNKERPVN